ncbi:MULTISPECIES: GIY-YIG nuclease family protein [unclassified Acinetobacter]|uniref:GIY-YIG nuclease family protein n=1 Tax=unclassified Acinetobacter TaxID=196816 RepID=UPI0029342B99|nr:MULTISPECIES: GIY-YIG nuclease family protein [unclassified Acinetobacter]WOE32266.1 GIY-YIG nuclease family protein [Acinetobacter sp. SAAs470]WOE37736.1 GIY-YIG nuclease family protein [Acinetobacter sp. SAAs474]
MSRDIKELEHLLFGEAYQSQLSKSLKNKDGKQVPKQTIQNWINSGVMPEWIEPQIADLAKNRLLDLMKISAMLGNTVAPDDDYLLSTTLACASAKYKTPTDIFTLNGQSDVKNFALPNHLSAIYIITEVDGDPEITFQEFTNFRAGSSLKCSRANEVNKKSNTLYVGSSQKNVKKRLKEHTINSADSTYALRLNKWFFRNYKIEVRVYGGITADVLQLIEDDLAYRLKPAFGKKGSNGK